MPDHGPDELVHRTTADGVTTITLDSPGNRNALSSGVRTQLTSHLVAATEDDDTRVIVLTHTGPVFCAGMDLREARDRRADEASVRDFPAILETIWTAPKPVVARVAGPARAGGVGIIAACDLAVAVESATFAFAEVRVGVVPLVISAVVRRKMLPHAVRELFLTAETFDARRAAATGLITAAVTTDRLDEEVRRYIDLLRLGAPRALAATKHLLAEPPPGDLGVALAKLVERSATFFASDEATEGMRAFAEKRPPTWA
jgi:methylglutaconyl-CoA hydratase